MKIAQLAALAALSITPAHAMDHAMSPAVEAMDQSVAGGTVTAARITAAENGWLVVHRTDAEMKPGAVVGYAPLKAGENLDVAAILTEVQLEPNTDPPSASNFDSCGAREIRA